MADSAAEDDLVAMGLDAADPVQVVGQDLAGVRRAAGVVGRIGTETLAAGGQRASGIEQLAGEPSQ